jgi:hypothetical protein
MSGITEFISSECDILTPKSVQTSIVDTVETTYKPIASIDQSDLEFLIHGESDTYVDLEIKLLSKVN